jgi:hypothetical protein
MERTMAKKRRNRLPAKGTPGSIEELKDSGGKIIQKRYYGGDGRAQKNIDYGHDHGVGDPHAHDWDWTRSPPRQPGRTLNPGE